MAFDKNILSDKTKTLCNICASCMKFSKHDLLPERSDGSIDGSGKCSVRMSLVKIVSQTIWHTFVEFDGTILRFGQDNGTNFDFASRKYSYTVSKLDFQN